jgi:hypothetical protein
MVIIIVDEKTFGALGALTIERTLLLMGYHITSGNIAIT